MKTLRLATLFLCGIGLTSCSSGVQNEGISQKQETPSSTLVAEKLYSENTISEIDEGEISEYEKDSLLLMREEEKLARDVYLELYDLWGQQIFQNIAASEQTHTNAVRNLLERFNIADPVSDDSRGIFHNTEMQTLYSSLIEQGKNSLLDALMVGATVEDLDIKDLREFSQNIDNEDILAVYANLERGSRNHLRSFTKNIIAQGGSYEAQYISDKEYKMILASPQERGNRGAGMGYGRRGGK